MSSTKNGRRNFIKSTAGGAGLISLPSLLFAQNNETLEKKKIVCIGGHPDDPESGCGGTLAKLRQAGHAVTIIYLTTGEAGIPGKSFTESAAIRKQEAINACKILDAKPVFMGQIDGDTVFNNEWIIKLQQILSSEKPDVVFTHWPIDEHKDHQVASLLTIQCWIRQSSKFALYFFEVCTGEQTQLFHPTNFVEITDTQAEKRKAVFCHASQDPNGIYGCGHAAMEDFRGRELGVKAAEAFIKMNGKLQGQINL